MLPPVTLTTDFGSQDAYVAAMKGAMLGIAPGLRFVDVTHEVAPQDVMAAAFVLRQALPYFPDGTVHLVVVDPGVGTDRRAIAAAFGGHRFVGPDNGLLPLLLDDAPPDAVVVLDQPAAWRTPTPSPTFHGRDVFGPVAAHLANGRALDEVGTPTEAYERLHWALPIADGEGIQGWVVHVDRFGNCITNVPGSLLEGQRQRLKCYAGSTILTGIHATYADVPPGEPVALVGSAGHLEIGVRNGDAAALLDLRKGSRVSLVYAD
ncbi:MAG: SAM-dependent chlorinase/fluorinase [Rubricoccaceae bacterium]|nr:SAM-dependent chlorinase/fluorinase [Rubricoccaceae bacterium]